MYHRLAQRLRLQPVIVLMICIALLPIPNISLLRSGAAQDQGQVEGRKGRVRPGKPEGIFPKFDEIRNQSRIEREAPSPIPSTIRSRKNEGRPWDGRRVGDPEPPERLDQAINSSKGRAATTFIASTHNLRTRQAHARSRIKLPPPLPDDQFVQNFFTWTLTVNPTSSEMTYWYDQLRVAYAQGQTSLKLAAIELGRTLFESAAYAARNRDAHWYVYDLYKSYLMRDPDPGGWATWESLVPTYGREYVRRGFEESGEFATIIATLTPNGSVTAAAASLISAQVDPRNQPGNDMLTRDANWSVPLLSLPGRAGLDLGLSLSYSSMVWTRSGPYIYFDEDNGFPSPGFRLGFPTVQRKVFDAQTARNSYLFITGNGHRVELRQVGTSNLYDAADSSYLRLTENVGNLWVHSTDGTRLSFSEVNGEYRCVEIKDRNGNYITVNYNTLGRITTITDTLSRTITFNYDGNANLLSITQAWPGQPSHQWVGFGWGTRTMQSSFTSGAVVGTANGAVLPVITQVTMNDTSYFTFDYSNSLQVSQIKNYFGALERNSTTFTYETPAGDAPRLLDSRLAAHNWSGYNNVPSQVITQYSVAGDGACVMTAPDGTIYKEYYGTGWQKGLTTLSEVWSGGVRQKWITTAWTQDNTAVGYEMNPRVTETNVYDASGNRRRTTIDYGSQQYVQYGLPYAVTEYAADGTTAIRQTFTDYNLSQAYMDRRIIGLVAAVHQTNISSWQRKLTYSYDDPARLEAVPAAATQHDGSGYNTSFTARGNVTAVSRWDVNDIVNSAKALTNYTNYYTTGTLKSATDPAGHQSSITYGDSFSDTLNRNTFAYPTTLTDADGFSATIQYNFDFGATTRTQSPAPAGQALGAIQTMTYNNLGQLNQITTSNNGAYTRFWYGAEFTASYATVNNIADEGYSIQVTDGLGQVIGAVRNHPGSTGGYSLVNTVYNLMGRAWLQSNPTEVDATWAPRGDDQAGAYYSQYTYNWQGRPLLTANPDLTISYAGCGCAGGEVVTMTDPVNRKTRIYSDVLGRNWKTEILNFNDTVYTTTVNVYNARDQVTSSKQYQGPATGDLSCPTGTCQETTYTYDGYGRLSSRHLPEQASGTSTTYTYRPDDALWTETDSRGAITTYTYNGRHLTTGTTYSGPVGVYVPAASTINYDAAGNRSSMTDGMGTMSYEYDQSSRLLKEKRYLYGLPNAPVPENKYTISYSYNLAGKLTSVTDPFGYQVTYVNDTANRTISISKPGPQGFPDTMTATHRAFNKPKQLTIGWNGNSSTVSYSYDSRTEASRFEVSSVWGTYGAQYSRYNDGRVSFAQDLNDPQFDHAYSYDQIARVTQGLSGAEARGTTPADGPYKQTYGYDAFDNLTSRTGRNWTQNVSTQNYTYTNNRNSQWQYDFDGRTTTAGTQQFKYDAGGRPVTPTGTIVETYDGDGLQIKHLSGYAQYEIRSSVFGGQVLTEINPQGTKNFTYDYANGQQVGKGDWEIPSPINSGRFKIGAGSVIWRDKEFTPIGDNVATENPYLNGGDPTGNYPSYGDPSSFKCAWDFVTIDCASLSKFYISKNTFNAVHLIIKARTPITKAELVPGGDHLGKVTPGSAGPGGETSTVEILIEPDFFREIEAFGAMETAIERPTTMYAPSQPNPSRQNPFLNQNQDCSIEVRFRASLSPGTPRFDAGPNHRRLGSYVGRFDKYTEYGLRYEVRGSVNGTIGHIGKRDLNNGGAWTIVQLINPLVGSNRNGIPAPGAGEIFDDSPKYLKSDNAGSVTVAVNGGTFAWHDGPGWLSENDDPLVSAHLVANFTVLATNGEKMCGVDFNIEAKFSNGRWSASIAPGYRRSF